MMLLPPPSFQLNTSQFTVEFHDQWKHLLYTSLDFSVNIGIQGLLGNYLSFFFPFPLSCLISQPFSWKWGWMELRCVVPHLSPHIDRNSLLCTDCITPLDESYFLPLDSANRVWKKKWLHTMIIMVLCKGLESLEWLGIKNKCLLWEVRVAVTEMTTYFFYQF